MSVCFNDRYLRDFVAPHELDYLAPQVRLAHDQLHGGSCVGNDFIGWVTLPADYDKEEYARIKAAAARIRQQSKILVVIGIGGSYLGARAAIEFLHGAFTTALADKAGETVVYFAGNNLSGSYLRDLLTLCEGKDFSVNVISKSGTTTEPALAFRIFRELLEKKYGKEGARSRIYCTTDRAKGTLKSLADREGYETFVVPDDIGGRYSVLSAVGLLPIAVAGADLDALMAGAAEMMEATRDPDLAHNPAYRYAAYRHLLGMKGKQVELLACHEPAFQLMAEWYKQLFGESEGKDHKGLFPASVIFSTDLHSMGQFIQEGSRLLFETVVDIGDDGASVPIGEDPENVDGLNFLAGRDYAFVSRKALEGTLLAHVSGGVPCGVIEIPDRSERSLGGLIYFFEKACAISGALLGVNPYNQPGVESYKRNMFALLGKPGYESLRGELEAKLAD